MGSGSPMRALWQGPARLLRLPAAAALWACLILASAPTLAQYNNPTPRSKQAGQQEPPRRVRNSTTPSGNRADKQFPRSGYNNPTPSDRQAGQAPGRRTRNNQSQPALRPDKQFPKSGYNNPTPRDRQAGQAPGRRIRNNQSESGTRPDQQFPRSGYNNPTPKDRQAGQAPGRKIRNNVSNPATRPNQQFPQNGNNSTTPDSRRANRQMPKVEKPKRVLEPYMRANAGIQSVEQRMAEIHPKVKKKLKRRSRQIARRKRGNTMARAQRKRFMRMQSRIMGPAVEGTAESDRQKRARASANSYDIARMEVGEGNHPTNQRRRMRFQSQVHNSGQGPVQEESDLSKRIRARSQSLKINRHVQPVIPDYANQVAIMAAGSADAAEFYMPVSEHIADKQYKAYKKSKQISKAHVGWGGVNLKARKARQHQKSIQLSEAEQRMVLSREAQTNLARDQSRKYANFEGGNTMDRKDYKDMLKEKSEKLLAVKGNTMMREDYRAMVKKKSEKISEAERGNTMRREARLSMMRGKSDDIADFEAGYLNTRAEKRARIRSFFRPGEYVANTPKEQREKARDVSGDIAHFEGKKRRSKREVKNAHSSTMAENNKRKIRDYDDRESNRRRTAFLQRWNRKGLLPVWMRKKDPKPKYHDVEKGLWYD